MKPIRFGKRFQKWIMSLLLPAFAMTGAPVQGNPRGGVVVHGAADIARMSGNQLKINQQSNAVIINWQDFSINQGQTTRFVQPKNGTALNRVVSGNISQIHGQLKANANVYVINPNGIVVGAHGVIDVGGNAVLSTLDIDDDDFLDGGPSRFYGNSTTGVTNFGTINSAGGDVVLMGGFVDNQGQIGALNGTVAIGAGGDILLEEGAGSKISVRGSSDYTGTGINNTGSIRGASAELKAHGNVYALAINNGGAIRANGADRSNGRVRLTATGGSSNINLGQGSTISARVGSDGGTVEVNAGQGEVNVAGRIDATGIGNGGSVAIAGSSVVQAETAVIDASGGDRGGIVALDAADTMTVAGTIRSAGNFGAGGEVAVTGRSLLINDTARISADGATSGGRLRIGGDLQGRDTGLREADSVMVETGATLTADADGGNGGTVIVWANENTIFLGDASAKARGSVGNGGLIEVSGKQYLYFDGSVAVNAANGKSGTVLFDPGNVFIGTAGANPPPLTSPVTDSLVSISAINQTLQNGANVLVVTESGNIAFESLGGGADDISGATAGDRNAALQWTNSLSSFGAFASGSIIVNNHIRTSGGGSINLLAGWDGSESDLLLALGPQAAWDAYVSEGRFGNNGGSVFVGSNLMTRHIVVGSRFGDTNVAGFDVRVSGSDTNSVLRFSQIGFHDAGYVFAPRLSRGGNFRLDMKVGAASGSGAWYLSDGLNSTTPANNQDANGYGDPIVGVVGQYEVDVNGDGIPDGVRGINSTGLVGAAGDETFIPYSNHFNSVSTGNWWWQQIEAGATIDAHGNPLVGSLETKDPLGLGGLRPENGAGTSTNGADINVIARGNVVLQGGAGNEEGVAMIGHGGPNRANWGGSGITTREIGNETVGNAAFSITGIEANQLERRWTFNGSVSDRTSTSIARLAPVYGNINVFAGVDPEAPITINRSAGTVSATVTNSGDVILRANQNFKTSSASSNSPAQIGHGGLGQFGEYYGDIHVEAGGNVTLQAGEATRSVASIGHTFSGHAYWNPTNEVDQQIRFFATAGDFDNPNLRRGELFSGLVTTGFDPTLDPVATRRYTLADYEIEEVVLGSWVVTLAPGNTGNFRPVIDSTTGNPTGQFENIHDPSVIINMNPILYTRGFSGPGGSTQGDNALAPLDLAPVGPITVAALDGSVVSGLHGDITVIANSGDILLQGYSTTGIQGSFARDRRFAQIGHGGTNFATSAEGSGYQNITGTPTVPFSGTPSLPDGREINYLHMPNGDQFVTGSRSEYGPSGSGMNRSLAFMTITGDIEVDAGGDILMVAGNDIYDFTQIGHGGAELADYETSSFILGDVSVTAGGDITVIGGGGVPMSNRDGDYDMRAWSQIGHGGFRSGFFGFLGDLNVDAGGNILLSNGAHSYSYAKIGHQGIEDWGQTGGNFIRNEHFRSDSVESNIAVTLTNNTARVEYSSANGSGSSVTGVRDFSMTGAGTSLGADLNTADVLVNAGGGITLNHLEMGVRQPQDRLDRLGVNTSNPAFNPEDQGRGLRTRNSYVQIGHGGIAVNTFNVNNTASNYDDKIGNITVNAEGGDLILENGTGDSRWTRIGNGVSQDRSAGDSSDAGFSRAIELAGDISVSASGNIRVDADAADENEREENSDSLFGSPAPSRLNPVVIGHGGVYNNLDLVVLGRGEDVNGIAASSNITTLAGGDLVVLGGKGVEASSAQIGHGFASDLGNDLSRRLGLPTGFAGDINVSVDGSIRIEGGANAWSEQPSGLSDDEGRSVTGAFAAIGHGGYQLGAPSFGNITVFAGSDLGIIAQRRTDPETTTAGASPYSISNPSIGSDAIASAFNFAKIGHFAVENGNRQANFNDIVRDANQEGDITVVVGRDLTVAGGTTPNVDTQTIYGAFAQIGHGGPAAIGNLLGNITVLVKRDVSVINGSELSDGTITITPLNNYAMIGNGDNVRILPPLSGSSLFRSEASGFRFGDIALAAGRNGYFDGALIGHSDPAFSTQTTSGRNQVAVSRLNPFFGGGGYLTAVNSTVFSSGSSGGEQMEFYLPARSNNLMDGTTRINEGTDTFATAPANFAGPFDAAGGIFAGRADEVYLTPDLWWDQTGLAASGGFSGAGLFPTDALSGQGGSLALVNEPGGLPNLNSLVAGSLGDSAPAYRDGNGVSGTGLYTIYYDATEFVRTTFPQQPTDPTIPEPLNVFNFDGFLFTDTFESFDRIRDFEEEERRKRAADDLIGEIYYVFDPATNLYSSYRVFGTPAWLEPVDPTLPVGITGAGGTIGAVGPIEGSPDL